MSIWTADMIATQNRNEAAGDMELKLVSLPPAWYRNFSVFIHRDSGDTIPNSKDNSGHVPGIPPDF
jgi:hypothetical protein